jgi:hypothetical protein
MEGWEGLSREYRIEALSDLLEKDHWGKQNIPVKPKQNYCHVQRGKFQTPNGSGDQMKPYLIRTPIWDKRSVGIATFRMRGYDFFDIKIGYRDKDGRLLYPGIHRIKVSEAMKSPIQKIGNVTLKIIPIENFTVVNV